MKNRISVLFISLIFSACNSIWFEDVPSDDKLEMFNTMWQDIDDNYVFFDQKSLEWDKVKADYSSQISVNMTDEAFFSVLSGVLSTLEDGHASLFAGFNNWNYYDLFLKHPSNFNLSFIQRNYLSQINEIGPFIYDKINPDIGYIYYKSFGDDFTYQELDYLLNSYFKDTKGIILDVRDNLGGASDNVTMLMSAFVAEDFTAGKMYTPDLAGDLIEDMVVINKQDEFQPYTKEILILTNRACYSSCNVFVGFMSQLKNVSIVGDTTGGGSGLAVASDLSNGWKYRYSTAKITLADDSEMEAGIVPDYSVSTGPQDELNGIDAILETAIDLLD